MVRAKTKKMDEIKRSESLIHFFILRLQRLKIEYIIKTCVKIPKYEIFIPTTASGTVFENANKRYPRFAIGTKAKFRVMKTENRLRQIAAYKDPKRSEAAKTNI